MDPVETLAIGVVLLVAAASLVWPERGLIARWRVAGLRSARMRLEDALKHLYDREYRNLNCTLEDIAGALSIRADEAIKLIARLEAMGLLTHRGTVLGLTAEGRSYALRIIRVHRLWERYLADETAVSEYDWHKEAEKREHLISADEAAALESRLGHPAFDPHGDPIPSASGELPEVRWQALTSLREGEAAGIVHIEDEPPALYAQLVAQGFYPGMRVRIIEQNPVRIRVEAEGNEIALAPVLAANLGVVLLPPEERSREAYRTLSTLKPGQRGVVTGISRVCRGLQRRRLMDLGVVPGSVIEVEMQSVSGDPAAYNIRGATIALRRQQAEMIFIEGEKERE